MVVFIQYAGRTAWALIYILPGPFEFFLSLDVLRALAIIPKNFPHHVDSLSGKLTPEWEPVSTPPAKAAAVDMAKVRPQDTIIPKKPVNPPFALTEGNVEKLECWLLQHFRKSTFNTDRSP